ncbi:Fes1-domain-containing protein [Tilletiaria anomala UBC 951]|uniref:Fes1-domain-containing protein n=1 Tax=Tilletiaria anomala (strain ATCC 24038 / CBS 436.72 / UBC 951) TaxID=1037660 RepID=A0A066W9K2_TILAU|nr:Fes1-domain-containing protein [Tilletiaria anomala UBC 951]KDN47754.1 Fes1-domain-containing protein [Tilletiaria anomala UBC 951]
MTSNRTADELLKWGLRHSAGPSTDGSDGAGASAEAAPSSIAAISADIAAGKRPDLSDPNLYQAIMGKSEAQMMQEELAVALDEGRREEDRCTALDNFEMLIEQVDNANNIMNMKMWPPLLTLLESPLPSIQLAAAWIVGTAVQNNDKAQMAVLSFDPLPRLLEILDGSDKAEVRSKAMYALSGILKHNPQAVKVFAEECDGWQKLQAALSDPNITLRRKTAFLICSLLLQDQAAGDADQGDSATPASVATGPSPALSNPTSGTSTPSRATAVVPHASSANPSSSAPSGCAPLELGPETYRAGVAHPNVSRAVKSSGLLRTLALSLLPPPSSADAWESVAACGEDGDKEARSDLDYAEKATRALFVFVERATEDARRSVALDQQDRAVLTRVRDELSGKPLDPASGSYQTRWEEIGIEKEEWQAFEQRLARLFGQ